MAIMSTDGASYIVWSLVCPSHDNALVPVIGQSLLSRWQGTPAVPGGGALHRVPTHNQHQQSHGGQRGPQSGDRHRRNLPARMRWRACAGAHAAGSAQVLPSSRCSTQPLGSWRLMAAAALLAISLP